MPSKNLEKTRNVPICKILAERLPTSGNIFPFQLSADFQRVNPDVKQLQSCHWSDNCASDCPTASSKWTKQQVGNISYMIEAVLYGSCILPVDGAWRSGSMDLRFAPKVVTSNDLTSSRTQRSGRTIPNQILTFPIYPLQTISIFFISDLQVHLWKFSFHFPTPLCLLPYWKCPVWLD